MQLISELAEKYAAAHSSDVDPVADKVHQETIAAHPHAHMLSSRTQGAFLSFISTVLRPRYILEIGTMTGYSALCLARGLSNDGELHTIELRDTDAATAKENFKISDAADRIILHCGDALEIIPALDYEWDLVFIDADKTSYITYYELVLPRLSGNGVIIADNVLFHGQVLEEHITGKNATAIHAFNEHVAADPRTEQVMLTVRDGLMLIKKRQ